MKWRALFLVPALLGLAARADQGWQALARRFPGAMAVVEDSRSDYDVAADGKYVSVDHYRATVLREPGIARLARYQDSYYQLYDRMTVKRAAVIGPDGRETPVDAANVKDLPMPAYGPFFIQNVRLVVISFPRLEVGSTVEVDLETRRNAPPMDGAFALREPLQDTVPVLRQEVGVTLPASLPLAWKVFRGQAACTRQVAGDRVAYRWEVGEQPQLVPEPGMPPLAEVVPVLGVTTLADWRQVSRWYARLAEEDRPPTPAVRRLAESITAGRTSRADRIRALFVWVARNIRYVETAFTGEKAGFRPAPADQTLERKYGVCRDKAQLLATLLRATGVEAHLVLINSGVRVDPDLPNVLFNHAITAVRREDGGFDFLDATAEDSRQYLPYSDQDKYALVCTAQGEDLQLTPLAPPAANRMEVALDTALGADGALATRAELVPTGLFDLALRQYLTGVAPARRAMLVTGLVARAFPGATVTGLELPDLDDLDVPARLAFRLTAPGQVVRADPYLLFTAPAQGGRLDLLLDFLLAGASAPDRAYPLELAAPLESRVRETIHLPAGCAVRSLPAPVNLRDGGAELTRACAAGPGEVTYAETFTASARYYAGPAYQGLRRLLEARGRLRDGKVILVPGGAR